MATFCLSGLWHGASWNFVIWGGLNGAGVLPSLWRRHLTGRAQATDTPGGDGRLPSGAALFRMACTFSFICLTWVFFRAQTFGDATTVLGKMATDLFDGGAWSDMAHFALNDRMRIKAVQFTMLLVIVEWIQRRHPHALARLPRWRVVRWVIYSALVWSAMYWGTRTSGQFIYFQF